MAQASKSERELHDSLLSGDPRAPSRLFQNHLDSVVRRTGASFRSLRDRQLVYDCVVDAFMNYAETPTRFDPDRLSLASYLTMSARGDLLNTLKAQSKQKSRETMVESVEDALLPRNASSAMSGNTISEEDRTVDQVVGSDLLVRLYAELRDATDQTFLKLMLQGERETKSFAKVLGIEKQSVMEQRRQVKRAKDRIKKHAQRMGGCGSGE